MTDSDVHKASTKLKINNFSIIQFTNKSGEVYLSGYFKDKWDEDIKWCLKLYPKGNNEDNNDYVSLFLYLSIEEKSDKKDICAKVLMGIIDINGRQTNKLDFEPVFSKPDVMKCGFGQFIEKSTLLNQKNVLLPNDTLTVYCEVSYYVKTNTCGRPLGAKRQKESFNVGRLLYESMTDADINIVVNRKLFKAHKLILKTRSPVFRAMFDNQMIESQTNRVEINDMDEEIFEQMLRFIYTVDIDIKSFEMSKQLFSSSDKYDLKGLKEFCEQFMVSHLSVENVCDVLILADKHSAIDLKKYCINFIKRRLRSVINTKGWKAMNLDLLNDIMYEIALVTEEVTEEIVILI